MLFCIQILIKKVLKNCFFSFWQDFWFWRMLFSIQILIKEVLKNWFFQLLARSWFWRMLFSIQILIKKVLKNWVSQLLARFWFSWMLFSIQILVKKVLTNWFFQLLARSWFWRMLFFYLNSNYINVEKLIFAAFGKIFWFWWMLFSIQILIKKVLKNWFFSFWQDLVFVNAFFYTNSNQKSIEKLIFPAFGKIFDFGECFFLFKF